MQQFDLFSIEDCADSTSVDTQASTIQNQSNSAKRNRRHLLQDPSEFFDGELHYLPQWLSPQLAAGLCNSLKHKLAWRQEQIKVYGKWYTSPRMQAWYGDRDSTYQYSGVMMEALPWTHELLQLKDACENSCLRDFNLEAKYNSVLANLYRSGEDCMGFHSDDEKELGPEPVIASVTLGGERHFDLVHKNRPYKLRLSLPSGSLLVMKGKTQKNWQHGIPRTKMSVTPRINLTFRFIKKSSR